MTSSGADYPATPHPSSPTVEELFRNVQPVATVEGLACDGIFESDDELDEFLAYTYAARRAELA